MADALRQVREEFGPDALVLSTRSVPRDRGIFGRFGRSVVEVMAAVDRDTRREARGAESVAADPSWRSLQLSRALVEPLEAEMRAVRRAIGQLQDGLDAPPSIAAEIAELRRIAADLGAPRPGPATPVEDPTCQPFLAAGLAARHARRLAHELRAGAAEGEHDPETLVTALALELDARMAPAREDDPPVLMLVGPTGVGKTSTLAKLAARAPGRRPALVTTDAHRFGAAESLRHFARELDVPFEVAVSPEGLGRFVGRLGRHPVLVDTAGRSRSDPGALPALSELRRTLGERARVHLVLSATTKEADLRAEIERYSPLAPDAVVFTKTDESGDLANVVNVLLDEPGLPLSWLGNGQRVPEDLEVPRPEALAERLLGAAA